MAGKGEKPLCLTDLDFASLFCFLPQSGKNGEKLTFVTERFKGQMAVKGGFASCKAFWGVATASRMPFSTFE